jgi:hypothetical protein
MKLNDCEVAGLTLNQPDTVETSRHMPDATPDHAYILVLIRQSLNVSVLNMPPVKRHRTKSALRTTMAAYRRGAGMGMGAGRKGHAYKVTCTGTPPVCRNVL